MSNCIEIRDGRVSFSAEDLDIDAFMTRCEDIEAVAGPWGQGLNDEDRGWWWFLSSNSEVRDGVLHVHLGNGRSTHCYRDFRWTIGQITRYILRRREMDFEVADEIDGFSTYWLQREVLEPERKTA